MCAQKKARRDKSWCQVWVFCQLGTRCFYLSEFFLQHFFCHFFQCTWLFFCLLQRNIMFQFLIPPTVLWFVLNMCTYSSASFYFEPFREIDSVTPRVLRRLCGVWRLCGWLSPSWLSCGSTTPTASTSAGLVFPERRSCCWDTVCLTASPPPLLRQHPPS